ncbi:MAG: hypothetical protein P4L16_02625 [Chlamydiales bacterium]|nr:hypothetical protein [Chlamydiales bacterium]
MQEIFTPKIMSSKNQSPKKFSDEEIIHLIHSVNINSSKCPADTPSPSENSFFAESYDIPTKASPSWHSKLMIPVAFAIFICSALYLYNTNQKNTLPIIQNYSESHAANKKKLLLSNAPLGYHQLATTLKALAKTRTDSLKQADNDLSFLLKKNQTETLTDFTKLFNHCMDAYALAEKEQHQFIEQELDHVFSEINPTTYEHLELFLLLVIDSKLETYLSSSLLKKLKASIPINPKSIKLNMQAIHKHLIIEK